MMPSSRRSGMNPLAASLMPFVNATLRQASTTTKRALAGTRSRLLVISVRLTPRIGSWRASVILAPTG